MGDFTAMQVVGIVLCAFVCEYVDSTLGMGYGTTLTPLFLLMGFSPMQIVPVVLLSELISGLFAAFCHNRQGNVQFLPKDGEIFKIRKMLGPLGYIETARNSLPMHLKIALLLGACSIAGTVVAVFVAVNIPKFWLKMYIGTLVLSMGVLVLLCLNRRFAFSIKRVTLLGLVASFNKGMSGGGYGPLVTSGQILSGIDGKSAVGITSLAEGLTCAVGVLAYILTRQEVDWGLAPYVVIGAVLSVPLSARSVRFISERNLKLGIALLTIILGTVTIVQTLTSR
ncbi:MAG: sulfite exporter TauE/SafE family protein [Phycisphaerae bacterium]|nr:sulfite exporter TauE/SafE family protein [Phycisphaerae bacterium]